MCLRQIDTPFNENDNHKYTADTLLATLKIKTKENIVKRTNNVVKFPVLNRSQQIGKPERLLKLFCDYCEIHSRDKRRESFKELRIAIFAYVYNSH